MTRIWRIKRLSIVEIRRQTWCAIFVSFHVKKVQHDILQIRINVEIGMQQA